MGKLVVLKMGDGNFEQGFTVTLQIGDDGEYPSLEIIGKLPKAPEIPQYYSSWKSSYRKLGARYRIKANSAQLTNVSKVESCCNAAVLLCNAINLWLKSEPFRAIREKLLEQLAPSDEIRVLVQTDDIWLQRLPWHLWDLWERYPNAEIALSTAIYQRVEQLSPSKSKVKILAIIGNSTGINTQADLRLLEQLPDAEVSFLVEPQHQELNEQLWQQGWDILFFAGHSGTHANSDTGKIFINQTDSLTIKQLKYAIEKAVERGLKIAFFNSCDGLGLGRELADLHIPQTILMREPVPDRVAQEFLKAFLEAFARGETFYLAVREARERLQGLESEFVCATWLPMICQNPAVIPPTWQQLCGKKPPTHTIGRTFLPKTQSFFSSYSLRAAFFGSLMVTSMLVGIRHLGMLQRWELQDFDRSIAIRPEEGRDGRILIVAITEEDFQLPEQKQRIGSLSDLALGKLLEKLAQFQPRAIGLDIYRDRPVDIKQPKLANFLKHNDNFFAICKVSDSKANEPGVLPKKVRECESPRVLTGG